MERICGIVKIKGAYLAVAAVLMIVGAGYAGEADISGSLKGGYRLLPAKALSGETVFTVYRGDYIKFDIGGATLGPVLSIPDLGVRERLPATLEESPYFKMKSTGTYAFTLGEANGFIKVVEYQQPNYELLSAADAAQLIRNTEPLLLDVRTPAEFARGHLEGAVLIPVQDLQVRWKEISDYRNQDVLIYCATGNRSTVASKILIDNGFKRILNLRSGIVDWAGRGHSVVQ